MPAEAVKRSFPAPPWPPPIGGQYQVKPPSTRILDWKWTEAFFLTRSQTSPPDTGQTGSNHHVKGAGIKIIEKKRKY